MTKWKLCAMTLLKSIEINNLGNQFCKSDKLKLTKTKKMKKINELEDRKY